MKHVQVSRYQDIVIKPVCSLAGRSWFPLQISRYSSQLWSDALQKYALSPRRQQIAAHRCDHAQANIRPLRTLPRQKLPGGSRRLWPRPGSDRRLQLRPGGGQLQQLGRVHVRGPVHCEPLPLRRRDPHPGQRQPVLRGGQCFKKFHPKVRNHGEGPYQGLLLVESYYYYRFHI